MAISRPIGPVAPSFDREDRRCTRCGRTGRNAFRPALGGQLWVCSHDEPCLERMRHAHRSAARRTSGRPTMSPITGFDTTERPACVIGSEAASREALAGAIADLAGIDVEPLDLSMRSLDRIARRDYGIVVADVRHDDGIALLDGLTRRLAGLRRRGVAVVVCHAANESRPAVEALVRTAGADRLLHPVATAALRSKLATIVGAGTLDAAG